MFTEVLSSIGSPIITITLVWVTALIIGQIVKVSFLKSAKATADSMGENIPSSATDKVRAVFKVFNIGITAIAIIAVLIFTLFMSNWGAKSVHQTNKIEQAPLPENFKIPTKEKIDASNEESVTKKSNQLEKEATEDNNKAISEATKSFGSVK